MLVALSEHQRRTAFADREMTSSQIGAIAVLVDDEIAIKFLELHPRVGIGFAARAERGGTHQHVVPKRPGGRLRLRVDPVPHRTALHENDRMVAILPRDRGGKARYEFRFRRGGRPARSSGRTRDGTRLR